MNIYDRIRARRIELEMTQEELAKKVGYTSRAAINKIETGQRNIKQDMVEKLAHALKTTPAYLMGWSDPADLSDIGEFAKIDLLASISAGYSSPADLDIAEKIDVPVKMLKGYAPNECKAFTVRGNSMYPLYMVGDILIIHIQPSVDSGDVAVLVYNGDEATVKRVKYVYGEDWFELIPQNPEYMTKRVEGENLEECHIIGKVIAMMRF